MEERNEEDEDSKKKKKREKVQRKRKVFFGEQFFDKVNPDLKIGRAGNNRYNLVIGLVVHARLVTGEFQTL